MQHDKKSKVEDVIERIQKSKNIPNVLKGKLIWKLKKKHDLDLDESKLVYEPVDFGEEFNLLGRKPVDLNWSDHAEFRSELRDVNPDKINEMIKKEMMEKLKNNDLAGDERLKEQGIGTAVVNYNLKKPEVDVISVWASKGEDMNLNQKKVIAEKYANQITKKLNYDVNEVLVFSSNLLLSNILLSIKSNEELKNVVFYKKLAKLRIFISKFYKSITNSQVQLSKYKNAISQLENKLENDSVTIFFVCLNALELSGIIECSEVAKTIVPYAKLFEKTSNELSVTSSNKKANIVTDYLNSCGSVAEGIGKIIDKLQKDKDYIQSMGTNAVIKADLDKLDKMIDELAKVELIVDRSEKKMENKKLLVSD